MDLSKHFVLLNGEPKTLQIDTIKKMGIQVIVCVSKTTDVHITMPIAK